MQGLGSGSLELELGVEGQVNTEVGQQANPGPSSPTLTHLPTLGTTPLPSTPAPSDPTHPSTAPPQPGCQGLAHKFPEAIDESMNHGGLGLPHTVHSQPRSHQV